MDLSGDSHLIGDDLKLQHLLMGDWHVAIQLSDHCSHPVVGVLLYNLKIGADSDSVISHCHCGIHL